MGRIRKLCCLLETVSVVHHPGLTVSRSSGSFPTLFRPRLLVSGVCGQGQTVHLAPAALHLVEHLPIHELSSSTLFAASAKMPEEACATVSTAHTLRYHRLYCPAWGHSAGWKVEAEVKHVAVLPWGYATWWKVEANVKKKIVSFYSTIETICSVIRT